MPKFSLDLTDKAVQRLQGFVTTYNQNEGTALTLLQWITLHLQEMAVAEELGAAIEGMRRQSEIQANRDFEATVKAERTRLIATL